METHFLLNTRNPDQKGNIIVFQNQILVITVRIIVNTTYTSSQGAHLTQDLFTKAAILITIN